MDLEKRLDMAQLLNDLLKQENLIKFGNKKLSDDLKLETEIYVKKHLQNLLLAIMGEKNELDFSDEEVTILKTMAAKIKNSSVGAKQ